MHEPGYSMAMIQKSDGTIELCEPGQSLEDQGATVTVVEVASQTVTVRHDDQLHELTVPPPPGGSEGR
jgi:hypothetical protein